MSIEKVNQLNSMEHEPEARQMRVTIYGTGSESSDADQKSIQLADQLTPLLIENGYEIATGGYDIGVMKKVTDSAVEKLKAMGVEDTKTHIKAFPLTEDHFDLPVASGADIQRAETLPKRLSNMIDGSDMFVAFGGKFGTITELIVTIESQRFHHMRTRIARPILIVDPDLTHLDTLNYLVDRDKKLQGTAEFEHIYFIAGHPGWQEKAIRILNLYKKQMSNQQLTPDEEEFLAKNNYQFNYHNWLMEANKIGYHF